MAAIRGRDLVMLMGDLGGFIASDDKRWEPEAVAEGLSVRDLSDWGSLLVDRCVDVAQGIRGQVIGSLAGNHELTYSHRHHVAIADQIAAGIGCPSLGYVALITLRFACASHERSLRVLATHGSGAAATPGGKLNRLLRTMAIADVDLALMGHVHACMSATALSLRQDGSAIHERSTLGVITGTYLRTYSEGHSGYGERAGYQPTTIGHPVITIVPSTLSMAVRWV
jgi:hypothetical protein